MIYEIFGNGLVVDAFGVGPPMDSLVGWYRADMGVTESLGKVTDWADQSGNGNDLTQATAGQQFVLITDNQGNPAMQLIRANATNMTVPSGMAWDARSSSLFIAGTISTRFNELNAVTHLGGLGTDGEDAALQNRSFLVQGFDGSAKASTIRTANTNGLFGFASGSGSTNIIHRGRTEAITQFLAQSGTGGSKIGNSTNPATLGIDGFIHEVLIYDKQVSASEITQIENYMNSRHGAGPDKDNHVFFDGDSHTQGDASHLTNDFWQSQLGRGRNWDFVAWTVTSGSGQTVSARDTAATTFLDPSIEGAKNVVVVAYMGGNDLVSLPQATVLSNLETYCDNRRTAGADAVVVGTVFSRNDLTAMVRDDYNAALRLETFYDGLMDFAADSRLQDDTDTTYFDADRVHLNKAGAQVMASIASPVLDGLL